MALSFFEVAELWKKEKRRYIKTSSYAVYVIHLNKHLLPFFGAGGAPDEALIQKFVDTQLDNGLSEATIRETLLVLKMIMRYGEKIGSWPNVIFSVHFPTSTISRKKVAVLTKEQQRALVRHFEDNFSWRNLGIIICLYSGLRIGEICALQWRDLDLDTGAIHVNKTVQRIFLSDGKDKEYKLSISTPKTASSVRDIPMTRELIKIVKPLRKVMKDDWYVVSNAAEPLEPRYLRDYFTRLLRSLDIPPLKFHCLRHTFATRCIESKCDYKTVSAILGHASLATTMDIYVHPGFDDKKRCIEKMASSLHK